MKRIILSLLTAAVCVGCTKELETVPAVKPQLHATKTITITVGDLNGQTKTAFDGLTTNWTAGDVLGVCFKTSDGSVYNQPFKVQDNTIQGNYAEFTGEIVMNKPIVAYYAYYPYSATALVNQSQLKLDVEQCKASASGSHNFMSADPTVLAEPMTVTAEYSPTLNLHLKPLMARVDFNIKYDDNIAKNVFGSGNPVKLIMRVYDGAETKSLNATLRAKTDIASAERQIVPEYESSNISVALDNIDVNANTVTASTMIVPWNITEAASYYFDVVVNGKTMYIIHKNIAKGFNFRQGTRTVINLDLNASDTKVVDISKSDIIGEGTLTDPYRVPTKSALEAVNEALQSDNREGIHYIQIADIEVPTWTPTNSNVFEGSYDGGGYTVTVDKISPVSGLAGLFAQVGGDAVISNVTVIGGAGSGAVTITNSSCAGMLAGEVSDNATIYNCHATGDLSGTATGGTKTYGGLIGRMTGGNIFGCSSFEGEINVTSANNHDILGGLIGEVSCTSSNPVIIKNCFASGNITVNPKSGNGKVMYIGGLVGKNTNGFVVNNYSAAKITVGVKNTNVGGIVGYNASSSKLENCYSAASITAAGVSVKSGVLTGAVDNTTGVKQCYYFAGQTASGDGKSIGTQCAASEINALLNNYVDTDVTYKELSLWTTVSGVNNNNPVLMDNMPN